MSGFQLVSSVISIWVVTSIVTSAMPTEGFQRTCPACSRTLAYVRVLEAVKGKPKSPSVVLF